MLDQVVVHAERYQIFGGKLSHTIERNLLDTLHVKLSLVKQLQLDALVYHSKTIKGILAGEVSQTCD